ncbi:hypothetical protein [Flavobacterium sp.]|uniref:hypothetical protein n=1 Tax=Flavobacterium sp. TaxID=239 RepID=UPI0008CE5C03|nr:hypothetical protein [Flavobacterium sp.]OGS63461.1 MAG: hypothetical protein A2X07_03665 [Flavobacteria bacterium GWF1_32_7]HBD26619.1 hypothetical protein [Flavobacterium sp.]
MKQAEHSKIINRIAKEKFKPFGITQKGQSRIWLDDRGWYTTIIEFQPYKGEKGTTLNVGVNFHWYEHDYFSFDIGSRQDVDFVNFDEDNIESFKKNIEEFCDLCLKIVIENRTKFKSIYSAKEHILNHKFTSEEFWGNYSKGIICGLTGNLYEMNKYFDKLLNGNHPVKWVEELKLFTNYLKSKSVTQEAFMNEIVKVIIITRKSKKLSEIEISLNE